MEKNRDPEPGAGSDGAIVTPADRALLNRLRFATLLLLIVAILGSAGSALSVVFGIRFFQRAMGELPRFWSPGGIATTIEIVKMAVLAAAYAIVASYLYRYAQTVRSAASRTRTDIPELLAGQHALFVAVAWAGGLYIVLKLVGAIVLTITQLSFR